MPSRIALFGGTFDPPHIGHLSAAAHARWAIGVGEVRLVVANDPWQKRGRADLSDARVRFDLVCAAVEGHPGLVADDAEVRRGGPTYTIDTVEDIVSDDPSVEVFLVLGADNASGLDSWHRADELRRLVTIASVERRCGSGRGALSAPSGWAERSVTVPSIDLSSTEIRRRVAAGEPIDYLVTDPVMALIHRLGLYRSGE